MIFRILTVLSISLRALSKYFFEYWQAWGINHLCQKAFLLLDDSHSFLLTSSLSLPWSSCAIPMHYVLGSQEKRQHLPLLSLLRELQRARSSPLSFFSRLDNPSVASLSLQLELSGCVTSFVAFRDIASSAYDRAQNCTQYSRLGHTNAKYSRRIPPFDRLTVLCLMHPNYSLPSWLPGHAAGSCWAAVTSTSWSLPAELLSSHSSPICAWIWHYSVPGVKLVIFHHCSSCCC